VTDVWCTKKTTKANRMIYEIIEKISFLLLFSSPR